MPDPYQPAGPPRYAASEIRGELDQFLSRLRDLGATPDELAAVARTWDDLDPDDCTDPDCFTRRHRDELAHAPDDRLRALILDGRAEYEHGTTTQEDADAQAREAAYLAALEEAAGRIGGNVASVLDWVGGDPVRARAMVELESAPEGAQRKTLLAALQAP